MAAEGAVGTEATRSASHSIRSASSAGILVGCWTGAKRQALVVLVLLLSDILIALALWQAALVLDSIWGAHELLGLAVAIIVPKVVVWVVLRLSLGLYPGYGLGPVEELRRQTFALLATVTIITAFTFASQANASLLSRVLLLEWALGLLVLAPVGRYFVKRAMMRIGLWGKPVVVFGAQEAGARVLKALRREWQLGFKPVAVFDEDMTLPGGMIEGVPYGGTISEAAALARERGVDMAILAMPQTLATRPAQIVNLASLSFRHVVVIPNLGAITNSAAVARDLGGILGIETKHNLLSSWARRVKRALDLFGALVGGLLASPLLIAIVVLIKLDSPGPAFYRQLRPGVEDGHFWMWKFRTMHVHAERLLTELLQGHPKLQAEWQQNLKLSDDPRITRIGRFLRATSLDELPQLWNVLRGEMSLVGPRPMLVEEIPKYGEVYRLYKRMRPGITGFWQVNGRSDTSYEERVEMVAYYVHNWSIWLDLVILARTMESIVLRRGAY